MSRRFAIWDLEEAPAYLDHRVLGGRMIYCCQALLRNLSSSSTEILGTPDDTKLLSSITLFAEAVVKLDLFESVMTFFSRGIVTPSRLNC